MSDANGLLGSDDLVTGEAVALDLPPATVALRVTSGLIDIAFELVLLVIGYVVAFVSVSNADEALLGVATAVVTAAVLFGLPTALETVTHGRTLGKMAVGLRAVRDDAGPITFRQSLVRALVGFVEIWVLFGVPALISSMVNPQG